MSNNGQYPSADTLKTHNNFKQKMSITDKSPHPSFFYVYLLYCKTQSIMDNVKNYIYTYAQIKKKGMHNLNPKVFKKVINPET